MKLWWPLTIRKRANFCAHKILYFPSVTLFEISQVGRKAWKKCPFSLKEHKTWKHLYRLVYKNYSSFSTWRNFQLIIYTYLISFVGLTLLASFLWTHVSTWGVRCWSSLFLSPGISAPPLPNLPGLSSVSPASENTFKFVIWRYFACIPLLGVSVSNDQRAQMTVQWYLDLVDCPDLIHLFCWLAGDATIYHDSNHVIMMIVFSGLSRFSGPSSSYAATKLGQHCTYLQLKTSLTRRTFTDWHSLWTRSYLNENVDAVDESSANLWLKHPSKGLWKEQILKYKAQILSLSWFLYLFFSRISHQGLQWAI